MSFSFDGENAATERPEHKPAAILFNWAQDATDSQTPDGTEITASWANSITANLRLLGVAGGVDLQKKDGDDDILVVAVQAISLDFAKQQTAPLEVALNNALQEISTLRTDLETLSSELSVANKEMPEGTLAPHAL